MIHIIRPGETLRRLSARYYGDWTLWFLIAEANHIKGRGSLTSGLALNIPEYEFVSQEHEVEDGDSYESLALAYYGSEHFSGRIRTANSEKIIFECVGENFVIPALTTAQSTTNTGSFNGA